jgi:hypothetical protein
MVEWWQKGEMMADSIVTTRLVRNLRYKITYIKIFETYLESNPQAEVSELLQALITAQQTAVGPLSRYLRLQDVSTQELELDQKLLSHAFGRTDVRSRLRFIYDGLTRATAWYKTQLMDRQMTGDPEVVALLLELGEIDAGKLWLTEAVMATLRVPTKLRERDWSDQRRVQPEEDDWQPRLVEDVGRSDWQNSGPTQWPRRSKYRRGD